MSRKSQSRNGDTESKLREQFRLGARNAVVRRIWNTVQHAFYPNMSQTGIADRLQMAKGNLTRWKRGEMSFEALVAVLADCCKQWADLPERPPNELLRIAGLARMVGCARLPETKPDRVSEQETAENVAIVCCLLPMMERLTKWRTLYSITKSTSDGNEELSSLVDEIVNHADALYNRFLCTVPINSEAHCQEAMEFRVPFRTADELSRVEREFAGIWDVLDDLTPVLENESNE